MAYCRRYCPPGYDPEDIAQEALAKAWSSWDRYSPARPFWPWVATIARRLCVDYWRRDERAVARAGGSVALEPCTQPRPDELSEAADECRMAVSAFRRLRPDHQRIVGLRDIEGWSYEDIARFEGVTVESIRGSLRRARMSLRKSYETLAKGGIMVGVPGLAGFVRLFQQARARMALRMARWQTTLNDTGIATTRLGDALVSLMAISVAVVGFGGAGGEVVTAGGSDSSVSTPAAPADTSAATAAGASTSQTASNGGPTTPVTLPVDGWTPSDYSGTDNILGVDGTDPDNSTIYDFEVSPSFPTDRTVFAVGQKAGCVSQCYTIFKSTDAGANWQDLNTVGLLTPRIMLPPAFPADQRIFSTGAIGFQVSENGGRSFKTLFASWGTAAMSPAFSSGDPRILLPDAPGLQYNDRTKLPEPMNLRPGPSTLSQEFTFGFPSAYDPAHPVMYVGAALPAASGTQGVVYRCEGTSCGQAIALPNVAGAPRISVVPTSLGNDVVLAIRDGSVFRSVDGASTFERVSLPHADSAILSETVGADGRVFAVTLIDFKSRLLASSDAGATWRQLGDPTTDGTSLSTVQPLPNGALLTSLTGSRAGFACSHDDGKSWTKRC